MTFTRICKDLRSLRIVIVLLTVPFSSSAQKFQPSAVPSASPITEEETIIPTFETQKLARTYILDVPAPRGQITDRNGVPLAQNKLSYNLAINFPTPLDFSDARVLSFVR
jgi:penicillin-binding protein 2